MRASDEVWQLKQSDVVQMGQTFLAVLTGNIALGQQRDHLKSE